MAQACPANHPTTSVTGKLSAEACPEYFRWIHEDLRPWKSTGISRFAVESAKGDADFRLVIVNGKAYVEQYRKSFQTTDLFTMWGIFQLLKLYPNRLPELGKRIQWRVQELQSSRSMHPQAQEIGKAGSNFIHEELKMDFVYDYMFHLLNEYSKLLKFKPAVPPGAVELYLETMDYSADAVLQKFVMESMVNSPSDSAPCSMPPSYSPEALRAFLNTKENLTRQVEMWGMHIGRIKISSYKAFSSLYDD